MLNVSIQKQRLLLQDRFLGLELGLYEGLLLLLELDEQLGSETRGSLELLHQLHEEYLACLLLLPPAERQAQFQQLTLQGLACILRSPTQRNLLEPLKKNLSNRRWQQLQEEPLYREAGEPSLSQLKSCLAPFFQQLERQIQQGELVLPAPNDPCY